MFQIGAFLTFVIIMQNDIVFDLQAVCLPWTAMGHLECTQLSLMYMKVLNNDSLIRYDIYRPRTRRAKCNAELDGCKQRDTEHEI